MITKEQYGEWRSHPATQFFRRFLRDRREALIRGSTEAWLNSPKAFDEERDVARGRILELFEVADLPFDAIEAFYKEQQEEDESQADQDHPR